MTMKVLGYDLYKNPNTWRMCSKCGTVEVWQQGEDKTCARWVVQVNYDKDSFCESASTLEQAEAKVTARIQRRVVKYLQLLENVTRT